MNNINSFSHLSYSYFKAQLYVDICNLHITAMKFDSNQIRTFSPTLQSMSFFSLISIDVKTFVKHVIVITLLHDKTLPVFFIPFLYGGVLKG